MASLYNRFFTFCIFSYFGTLGGTDLPFPYKIFSVNPRSRRLPDKNITREPLSVYVPSQPANLLIIFNCFGAKVIPG